MLLYEVNLYIDKDIAETYSTWLRGHIQQMLHLDGFEGAMWYEREPSETGRRRWTVHYHVKDWDHLEWYFEQDADAMRKDARERFGDKFSADRRVLRAHEQFLS